MRCSPAMNRASCAVSAARAPVKAGSRRIRRAMVSPSTRAITSPAVPSRSPSSTATTSGTASPASAAGRPPEGVLDLEDDRPPVGAQPRPAGDEVVLHLDEEGVAPLHRGPHPGKEVITAAGGALEPQRERHPPGHGRVVAHLDEGVELERRPPQ